MIFSAFLTPPTVAFHNLVIIWSILDLLTWFDCVFSRLYVESILVIDIQLLLKLVFSCPEQLNRTHCPSVGPAPLTIRVFTTLQSDPRDLWPLRQLIRMMRRLVWGIWDIWDIWDIRDIWDDFVPVLLLFTYKERPLRPDNDNGIWDIWDIWDIC